ncbi:MAG TPA: glycosyltransferase family 2 protein [Candidatus Hydrogenedentes bacterium]|nr:glycosyltransferase family 2 protein [Candidatus Hydrogenedentota bacterium]
MRLSLIIPAYNEERRLGDSLRKALAYLDAQPYDSEVIIVDDGSRDRTIDIVRQMESEPHRTPLKCLAYTPNQGKGYAVRTGMTEASGEFRVYTDADASTPIEELEKFWPRFDDGADIVIGSRALPDSDVAVHQAWYRESMGRTFNLLLRMLRLTHFKDTQCGFKGFTRRACEIVFPRQHVLRFSFDAELLYIAQKHGLRIDEAPVRWLNNPESRVHPISDSTRMAFDMLIVRLRNSLGKYK